jgi:hypothetical protein
METMSMRTTILAAVATASLGFGAAYAAGVPAGSQDAPQYGTQAFSAHPSEAQTQFLGLNTVLGKMFRSNSDYSATTTSPAKGG